MTNTNTRIYIANLGKYNEGELVGGWIDLPFAEEELHKLFVKIGLGQMVDGEYEHGIEIDGIVYEEYAIHDYETDIPDYKIEEYENLEDLNGLIERIEDLDEYEYKCFCAYREATQKDIEHCLDQTEYGNVVLYEDCNSLADLAEQFADEGLFGDTKEMGDLVNYIDYEALGRNLGFDGYVETSYGVVKIR